MVDWAEAGYLLPLDDIVQDIGKEDFVEGSLFTYDGHVYAVPYATSVYGVWVRTDLLSAAGLPLPQTYEDVLKAAQVMTCDGVYGIGLPAGQNIATINDFSAFVWQNGADYFSCNGDVTFDNPAALEAIAQMESIVAQWKVAHPEWKPVGC